MQIWFPIFRTIVFPYGDLCSIWLFDAALHAGSQRCISLWCLCISAFATCTSAWVVLISCQGIFTIHRGAMLSHLHFLIEFQSGFPTICWGNSCGTPSNAPSHMLSDNSSFSLLGLSVFSHLGIIHHMTTFYINEALVVSDVMTFCREQRK